MIFTPNLKPACRTGRGELLKINILKIMLFAPFRVGANKKL
jgi:hypothetical protein